MHYRFVRIRDEDQYVQIFNEEDTELFGSIIRTRRLLFWRQYQIHLNDRVFILNRSLLSGRKWKLGDISIRFKLFGTGLKIKTHGQVITGGEFKREKMTLSSDKGRTVAIIDPYGFKSADMILVEDYQRIEQSSLIAAVILVLDRYEQWK